MSVELTSLSLSELLKLHGAILNELQKREICRSENNPTGDYAKYLACQRLELKMQDTSNPGYDSTCKNGLRYQIKGRRVTPKNKSTQLGVLRNLEAVNFDYLIGVLLDENYSVVRAAKIPHSVISEYAKYNQHQNGHILFLNDPVMRDIRVKDLTSIFVNS